MRPLQRETEAAEAAGEHALKLFQEGGTDEQWLAIARETGLAAARADHAAFRGDMAARLADARMRARAAACAVRLAATFEAEYMSRPPTDDSDEGQIKVRILPSPERQLRLRTLADQAEDAAAGQDADVAYVAAIRADNAADGEAFWFSRGDDLKTSLACCREHRHRTDPDTSAVDAAHYLRHVAYQIAAMAAGDRGDYPPDLRSCCRKRRFDSESHAEQEAERGLRERGVPLRVYNCPVCRGWHLTSRGTATTM